MIAQLTAFAIHHIPPGSPAWFYPAVMLGLALHIGGGSLGIVTGYAAVLARKGERLHRSAGTAFFASMLVMTVAASFLAVLLKEKENLAGGVLAFYMVVTAWSAARRKDNTVGVFDYAALVLVLGVAVVMLSWGLQARAGNKDMLAYEPVFFGFASLAALAASLDIKVILARGIGGSARIARHLWRMCFAFFFAAGSFFLGQQKVMPHAVHGSPVLYILGFAPLGFLVFWLIRVRVFERAKRSVAAA